MSTYSAKRRLDESQLMVLSRQGGTPQFSRVGALDQHLRAEDLLVMNSSATIPASLQVSPEVEIRLAAYAGGSPHSGLQEWWAVVFGAGEWRQPTEERGPAPWLKAGTFLMPGLRVIEISSKHRRLVRVRFEGEDYLQRLYRHGKPIQYAYHRDELELWDVQTLLGGLPLSVEPPSALIPFSWRRLFEQPAKRAFILHGAGLSSTGEAALDALLPLPEYFEIPERTRTRIDETKQRGGRVIAVGTSVARALESSHRLARSAGVTDLRLNEANPVQLIDGLLTGYHEPSTSHFQLEEALLPRFQLETGFQAAAAQGFIGHEFGDAVLIL